MERKQQLERSLATTIENGNFVTESDPIKIFFRDWYLWLVQLVPSWRHALHLGNRREGMVQYTYETGMPFMPQQGGGKCLPQVYCRNIDHEKGDIYFTDDVIWDAQKPALFKLVVLLKTLEDLHPALDATADVQSICTARGFSIDLTIILDNVAPPIQDIKTEKPSDVSIYRVVTADEFAESSLCQSRPRPVGYDPYRLGKEVNYKKFSLLRPDRIVFASCDTRDEIKEAARQVAAFLTGCEVA